MRGKVSNELLYYAALRRIAKEYMTPEQLRRRAEKEYGLTYHEALEMAYENMQGCAADAIWGKRAPKPAPPGTEAVAMKPPAADAVTKPLETTGGPADERTR